MNESTQFHTLTKIIQYTMSRILRIKEQPIGYKMLNVTIMEPWKAFTSRVMKWLNIKNALSMKVLHPNNEPKKWRNNANRVTPTHMQWKLHEGTYMSLLSRRHCNLYISKKVSHVHVKTHERLEIKSTNRGFA